MQVCVSIYIHIDTVVYLSVLFPLRCLLTHLRHRPHLRVSLLWSLPGVSGPFGKWL